MNYATFKNAKLFRAGIYPDKDVSVSEADLRVIAQRSNTLGNIVIDLAHADTEDIIDTGYVIGNSIKVMGDWLVGTLEIPMEICKVLKTRKLSVVLDMANRLITKCTITNRPRVVGAEFSADTITFTSEVNMSEEQFDVLDPVVEQEPIEEDELAEDVAEIVAEGLAQAAEVLQETADSIAEVLAEDEAEDAASGEGEASLEDYKAKIAELEAMLADQSKALAYSREKEFEIKVNTFSENAIRKGVPPAVVNALAKFACKDEVTFSVEDRTFADASKVAINALIGAVPMQGQLPVTNEISPQITFDSTDFGSAVVEKAKTRAKAAGETDHTRFIPQIYAEMLKNTKE